MEKIIMKRKIKYLLLKNITSVLYPVFLKYEYKKRTGDKLNLSAPKKYTEKVQYAKIYLNSHLKSKLSDKYLVREWIEKKIGSTYLIPILGVWDEFSDINFENLPNKFVLKLNNGSDTNIIVKDKNKLN